MEEQNLRRDVGVETRGDALEDDAVNNLQRLYAL